MDAVKYFKERLRMVNSIGGIDGTCNYAKCTICPLYNDNNAKGICCSEFETLYPEKAVAIIEKWAAEHPQKTMLQDFLEKYPKAILSKRDGAPGIRPYNICPHYLGYGKGECNKDCTSCWNRPIEG